MPDFDYSNPIGIGDPEYAYDLYLQTGDRDILECLKTAHPDVEIPNISTRVISRDWRCPCGAENHTVSTDKRDDSRYCIACGNLRTPAEMEDLAI